MPIFRASNGDTFRTAEKEQGDWLEISEQELFDHLQTRATGGPSFADLKAIEVAYWKAEREKMIARMTSIESQLNAIGDTAGAASCRALRQSLLGLFTDPGVTGATTMPALKAAFKARYKVATDLATTSAKLEFLKYES